MRSHREQPGRIPILDSANLNLQTVLRAAATVRVGKMEAVEGRKVEQCSCVATFPRQSS